jgi:photosystem II stability/assembly factor-like uncharacterized protein
MKAHLKILFILTILFFTATRYNFAQSGWFPYPTGANFNYYSIHFEDNLTGWVCGQNGSIFKTTNGGVTWFQQLSTTSSPLRSVYFTSGMQGCACGDNGTIIKTATGGTFWNVRTSGTISNLNSIYFVTPTKGWSAGEGGIILKTTNAGDSWTSQQSGVTTGLKSVYFSSENNGWAVGSTGKILKTTNGGANWVISVDLGTITNLYSVYFVNSMTGYVAGDYTSSQGNKFVFFYKTLNSGEWWLYQYSGVHNTMRSIYFADELQGWAAGDSGMIIGTINGGDNWIGQPSRTTQDLHSIYFSSLKQGWVSGDNGTVLKTITGGYFDTLNTSRRDMGVIPIILNSSFLLNAKYRVLFRAPDTSYNVLRSLNNGVTFDTLCSHLPLTDTGRAFDGLLLRVEKIRFNPISGFYSGNAGVVKDPGIGNDSIQTRQFGWDYFPSQNRYLEGSKFQPSSTRPWQSKSMSISYPCRTSFYGFNSLLKPEDLRKVKIVFTGYGNGQIAYRYLAVSSVNFQYQDMREVPIKVYEAEEYDSTSQPRQLNCAFLEFPDGSPNAKWEPTADSMGGKEVLYIFGSDYNPNPDSFYTSRNLLLQMPQIDIMYAWAPKLISPGLTYHVNDEFYIYPYTVTRPDIVPGYPLFYEFQTHSLIGVKQISNEAPVKFILSQNYPNPFNPKTKIKFDLPKANIMGRLDVQLKVYDILGREVSTIVNSRLAPGRYEAEFDGTNLSSGVYLYVLHAGDYFETKKMVLLK